MDLDGSLIEYVLDFGEVGISEELEFLDNWSITLWANEGPGFLTSLFTMAYS